MRTLLATARHRSGLDETSCWLVLEWLETGLAVRETLRKTLASHRLSELKFSVLVTLFTLDPSPPTEADLANHARVTRPSVSRALDELQEQRLVTRVPGKIDHRFVNVRLTKKGHAAIDEAIQQYLKTAGHLARFLEKDVQTAASVVCARLRSGADGAG
jgi:DNA-binding MarR family transcriptional regulator